MAYKDYADPIIKASAPDSLFENCHLISEWLLHASVFHVGFVSLSAARRCVACLKDVRIVRFSNSFYILGENDYIVFKNSVRILSQIIDLNFSYLSNHFYLYFPFIDDFDSGITPFYPVTDLHNKEI